MTEVVSARSAERVAAGLAALDLVLQRVEGGQATLREFLADPLIVFVWASW